MKKVVCVSIGVWLVLCLWLSVAIITLTHLNYFDWVTSSQLMRSHIMSGGFGALGSSVAAIRKYYRALISSTTDQRGSEQIRKVDWNYPWAYYYATRPLLGGVLGALTFTMSNIGFQILSPSEQQSMTNQGTTLLYALSAISGFSVSQVLDRINSVSQQLFKADLNRE